jgi:Tfp pilus assembly protein PilF
VAQKVKSSKATRARLLAGIAAILILGLSGVAVWRQPAHGPSSSAPLPAPPTLAGKPAILRERLLAAERKAREPAATPDAMAELGRLYYANGFIPQAEACWEFLRRKQPADARWTYYLADLRRSQSNYAEMTALLEQTLALAPNYAPARLQLANLQLKSGEFDAAARNYRLRLEALPQDPYARVGLVRIALQAGRTDEARALLEQLLNDTPHFSTGHNLYAELLAAAGDDAGANRHRWLGRETLRYREPEDPWLEELQPACYDYDRLCVSGTIEFQTEQHDRARIYFERAIEVDPARPHAYEMLASVYLKRGDAGRARDLLTSALPRLEPAKAAGVFASLSQAYRALEEPREAIRVARQGLEQVGQHSALLDALGAALAAAGEHEEAISAWKTALAQNPGDAAMNHNLARSFLALRRLDDALAALDRSLTLQPTYLPTLLLRGEIELQAGHLDAAANYLRPAFESHPEDAQARQLLATWHLRMATAAESRNDPAAAEQHYRDGLTVHGEQPELLARLGLFYLLHSRFADAVDPLESYHRLQPESAPGCLFLGQAYLATNRSEKAREILARGLASAERSGNSKVANDCRRLLQQL